MCAQFHKLKELCVIKLIFQLTLDNVAEMTVLAYQVDHEGLSKACVEFTLRDQNRCGHDIPLIAFNIVFTRRDMGYCNAATTYTSDRLNQQQSCIRHVYARVSKLNPALLQLVASFWTVTLRQMLPCS